MRYTAILIPDLDDGGYVAYVPALPGCVTQGETLDEALAMAQDAAALVVESMIDAGEDVPIESSGAVVASIDLELPTEIVA